jgi:predicted RNA binding protein YcfA (HicA-like mRNA interferase family)
MPDTVLMKPADLLRRLRRLATKRGWDFVETEGSNHTKVTLNGNRTAIGRHPKDLKNDTFRGILKQLGLKPSDLED